MNTEKFNNDEAGVEPALFFAEPKKLLFALELTKSSLKTK